MPNSVNLEKAELHEVDAEFKNEINADKNCKVQFNPESLKVSFANQVATPSGAGDQKGLRRANLSAPALPNFPCNSGLTSLRRCRLARRKKTTCAS